MLAIHIWVSIMDRIERQKSRCLFERNVTRMLLTSDICELPLLKTGLHENLTVSSSFDVTTDWTQIVYGLSPQGGLGYWRPADPDSSSPWIEVSVYY